MDIYLLDVGNSKYGDCIVVAEGNRRILIDGAHPQDTALITRQLEDLFGPSPIEFDLLVVTHCHMDHIGCLPELVSSETIRCSRALVADEKLGWGRDSQDDSPVDALPAEVRKVVLALQEEPVDDASPDEIRRFLEDAATLESKYKAMITTLINRGTSVIRYGRDSASRVAALENEFNDFGLKVLGPTQDHLLRCAAYIAELTHDAADSLRAASLSDAGDELVSAYRQAVAAAARRAVGVLSDAPLEDRPGVGAAKNDQSIVLKVASQGTSALLTGDMQFAAAEVPDLDDDMEAFRAVVRQNGPYDFVKLSHHTSYNGFSEDVWNEWETTYNFAHTGGRNDSGHPDRNLLRLLRRYRDDLQFARTDRNGLVTVRLDGNGVTMSVERGSLNNFYPNRTHDTEGEGGAQALQQGQVKSSGDISDVIEVTAKVPAHATRVTITVELEPVKKN